MRFGGIKRGEANYDARVDKLRALLDRLARLFWQWAFDQVRTFLQKDIVLQLSSASRCMMSDRGLIDW